MKVHIRVSICTYKKKRKSILCSRLEFSLRDPFFLFSPRALRRRILICRGKKGVMEKGKREGFRRSRDSPSRSLFLARNFGYLTC